MMMNARVDLGLQPGTAIASTQSQTSAASNETDAPRPHSLDGLDRLASRQDILGALQTPGTEYFWS